MKMTVTDWVMARQQMERDNDKLKIKLEEAKARRYEVQAERRAKRAAKKAAR